MGSESDGTREEGAVEQGLEQSQAQGVEQSQRQEQPAAEEKVADDGYKSALAERDKKIAELEAQVAEAAASKEAAEKLSTEIEKVRAEAADERVAYELRLAGVRNVKAARALLADHEGDVAKLKEAEPWLFAKHAAEPSGATGLEPAGAATSDDADLKHWREIAGLTDDKE